MFFFAPDHLAVVVLSWIAPGSYRPSTPRESAGAAVPFHWLLPNAGDWISRRSSPETLMFMLINNLARPRPACPGSWAFSSGFCRWDGGDTASLNCHYGPGRCSSPGCTYPEDPPHRHCRWRPVRAITWPSSAGLQLASQGLRSQKLAETQTETVASAIELIAGEGQGIATLDHLNEPNTWDVEAGQVCSPAPHANPP